MTMRALTEVEAAAALGFARFSAFQNALKKRLIPAPTLDLPDGPRWSESDIERWLANQGDPRAISEESRNLIKSINHAKATRA